MTADQATPISRVAISGATGLIGSRLVHDLTAAGYSVTSLQRGKNWNVNTGELHLPTPTDAIIHLAGRSVATRWTSKVRREIWDSRVPATEKLCAFLAGLPANDRPKLLLTASAIGIYGNRGDELLTESSSLAAPNASFLAQICRAWEAATQSAEMAGIRTIHLRFGVVLSPSGGALAKILTPTRLFLGGPVSSGRQFVPWIALTDASRLILYLLQHPTFSGPVNIVAPEPARQHDLARTIAKAVHRPSFFPLPAFMVKLAFGQMGVETLLASQRVTSTRIPPEFTFQYPMLPEAITGELASIRKKA